jgi:hypothetical protein
MASSSNALVDITVSERSISRKRLRREQKPINLGKQRQGFGYLGSQLL